MEQLNEKVYECTLAVEAHMICDLLARETYRHGERISAEFDRDGNGTFEQRVEFDRFDMPK
jgi:hypothetical protein